MTHKFNKGHIIPRWCGVKTDDRKTQHNIVFGCDVEVSRPNGCITIKALTLGSVVVVRNVRRKMPNGTTKHSAVITDGLYIIGGSSALCINEVTAA